MIENYGLKEYEFKAVIKGTVVGTSYQDAIENVSIPSLISSIEKCKVKNIKGGKEDGD